MRFVCRSSRIVSVETDTCLILLIYKLLCKTSTEHIYLYLCNCTIYS